MVANWWLPTGGFPLLAPRPEAAAIKPAFLAFVRAREKGKTLNVENLIAAAAVTKAGHFF